MVTATSINGVITNVRKFEDHYLKLEEIGIPDSPKIAISTRKFKKTLFAKSKLNATPTNIAMKNVF